MNVVWLFLMVCSVVLCSRYCVMDWGCWCVFLGCFLMVFVRFCVIGVWLLLVVVRFCC